MSKFIGFVTLAAAGLSLLSNLAVAADTPDGNKAPVIITLMVPADAQVSFDGTKTKQTGTVRRFECPPIATGKTYKYEIVVSDGTDMNVTRAVRVRGGERVTLDFRATVVRETRGNGTGSGYFEPPAYVPVYAPYYGPSYGPRATPLSPDNSPINQPYGFGGAVGGG